MSEEPPYKNTKSTNQKDLSGAVLVKTIFEDVGDSPYNNENRT